MRKGRTVACKICAAINYEVLLNAHIVCDFVASVKKRYLSVRLPVWQIYYASWRASRAGCSMTHNWVTETILNSLFLWSCFHKSFQYGLACRETLICNYRIIRIACNEYFFYCICATDIFWGYTSSRKWRSNIRAWRSSLDPVSDKRNGLVASMFANMTYYTVGRD